VSRKRFLFSVDADWIPGSDAGLRRLYDFCDQEQLRATVFATGKFAETYPALLREGAERGWEVGTHGWEHPLDESEDFITGTYEQQRRWMELSANAVENATGTRPVSFRAPNLHVSEVTLRVLGELGYKIDSSVPAHRFDFFYGQVNNFRYFRAPLDVYHPSPANLAKRGDSAIIEVPPSAFFLPMNMSSLRVLGIRAVKWAVRRISERSPILVFYVHPIEFEVPENQTIPGGAPARYHRGLGPQNLELVRELVHYVRSLGYESARICDVAEQPR